MMTWFTSDQHYGHRSIILHTGRPFANVEEMNEVLVESHNAAVRPEDDVWHIGDFGLDARLVKDFLPRLRGTHHLVAGNHDTCHPCHRRHEAAARKYVAWGFASVHTEARFEESRLCHLPYEGDSTHEARYPEHRPVDDGSWLIHGHVHELWKVRGRMLNVGVEQSGFAPVSLERIRAEITLHR